MISHIQTNVNTHSELFDLIFRIFCDILTAKGGDNMNERLKQLRKALGMTMDEFGRLIGISKSGVSEIEQGRRNVTEQHLIMLSNTTPKGKIVNIDWLRTGKGKMFYEGTEYDFVAHFTADLMKERPGSFKNRFIKALSELSEDDWKTIEEFAKKLSEP